MERALSNRARRPNSPPACLVLAASLLFFLLPVLVPGVGAAELAAQEGTVQGRVVDAQSGEPLVAGMISITNAAGGIVATRSTNRDGFWSANLAPGTYTVTLLAVQYGRLEIGTVNVQAGATERLDFRAEMAAIRLAEITVTQGGVGGVEEVRRNPSAVAVVSPEELRLRPTTTPVDHLRSLAQVDVIQQGVQSTNVVVRGFNNIFSGALHTMTDHRVAGVPSLRVNVMNFIPTTDEDIEQMELIFGPASALYGPNTANGVLHILTRSPLRDQGTSMALTGGERSLFAGVFRTAHQVGENVGLKVSGQYFRAEEWDYVDPTEVAERQKFQGNREFWRADMMRAVGISQAEADQRIDRIGARDQQLDRWSGEARMDWAVSDDATAYLSIGRSNAGKQVEMTGLGAAQVQDWSYTFYQARFERNRLFAQLYLNQSNAGDTYLLRNGAPIVDRSKLWVGQLRHGSEFGTRNSLIYGVDFVFTDPETDGTINGIYEDDDQTTEIGAYVQNRTRLTPDFDLVVAARIDDHSALPDPVFSPRAALVYNPVEGQTFRASFNRAFSTPSSLNQFLDLGTAIPNAQLAQLGYSVRVQGTGTNGFRFGGPGAYQMRSPFTPAQAGGPATLLPAQAVAFWAAAAQVVGQQAGLPPQVVAYIQSLQPTAAQIGSSFLSPLTGEVGPLAQLDLPDVEPIRESLQSTFEVGYRGVLADRFSVQADVWHSRRSQLVTPLTVRTPLVLMDGQQVGAFLVPQLVPVLMQAGMSQAEAQATATQIAIGMASVPVGVISSADVNANGAQLLSTYTNVDDDFDLWGVDLGARFLVDDNWTLRASAAIVNDDYFTTSRGEIVTLNAPKRKASAAVGYRSEAFGLDTELRARYAEGFPASSGVYEGTACLPNAPSTALPCVDSSTLFDLTVGFRVPNLPGTSVQLSVTNLADKAFQSFPGTPEVGRMALLRLRYEF
jgi:outer membrane receptor for ferrienterochelin and colicins